MGKVMALMPLTDSDEYRAPLAELAAPDRRTEPLSPRRTVRVPSWSGSLDVEEGRSSPGSVSTSVVVLARLHAAGVEAPGRRR